MKPVSDLWPLQGPMASCAASSQCQQHAGTSVVLCHPYLQGNALLISVHYIHATDYNDGGGGGGVRGERSRGWALSQTSWVCTRGWDLGRVLSLLRLNDERGDDDGTYLS